MKNLLYILLFGVLSYNNVLAQDGRFRTEETVVMDVLAQLPSSDKDKFDENMLELAVQGRRSIEILSNMMLPPGKGNNAGVEYAISGLVSFVSADSQNKYEKDVRDGLRSAIKNCNFSEGKAFLISQLQLCSEPSDMDIFLSYINDEVLASPAINAIINTTGSEDVILELIKDKGASPILLAYAAREKQISEAEPYLLSMLKEVEIEDDKKMIYSALGICGTEKSLEVLSDNSVNDYLELLKRLSVTSDSKKAVSAAKKMLKHADSYIRACAAEIVINSLKGDVDKELMSAMKSDDREYRTAFLRFMSPYMTDEQYNNMSKRFESFSTEAQEDYVNMLANNKVKSQEDFLINVVNNNPKIAISAIDALGMIEGNRTTDFLISQLGGKYDEAVSNTISYLTSDIKKGLISILQSENEKAIISALKIVSARRMKETADIVFSLISSERNNIKGAAYKALCGVVTEKDVLRISSMVSNTAPIYITEVQKAFMNSISMLDKDKSYETVSTLMDTSLNKSFYYPALASTGTDKAVEKLIGEFKSIDNKALALNELLKMKNSSIIEFDLEIIKNKKYSSNKVIKHYLNLVNSSSMSYAEKCARFADILALDSSMEVKKEVLKVLSSVPTEKAFNMASNYLEDSDVAYIAASTVKSIGSNKLSVIDYKNLNHVLEKAISVYEKTGSADDGYAIDEIKKLLNESKPLEPFVLPEEERKLGFEVLFDGTDLSNWEGDTLGYKAVNGVINVSTEFGNSHNLYTKKEYKDFIFRFEFCFDKEGVNNGVGIRTPMFVNAAYNAMCEIQILDHDAPIYHNLEEYQVHGSVYGIIPAKRIKHKPLGEWSEQEIKVLGNHITVKVDGKIILDGNVKEACQGHNISPVKGEKNPYTLDGKDHPGLFNTKGHISFCGHGAGIKFRNIRILEIGK